MSSEMPTPEEQKTPSWQTAIGVVVLTALVVATALAVIQIYPHKLQTTANPSFVDNIFDSRIVILGVRVALIFAAGYIVISVVGLIVARRWLSQLGPFKASDPIARLDNNAQLIESDLQDAVDTIQNLEQRLVESDESLAKAQADIDALVALVDTIEAKKEGH
jgi:peptidoglycan hydrolase CwlO-like protein